MIVVLTVNRCRDITRGIQRAAVSLENQARRHAVLVQVDNGCTVVQLEQSRVTQLLYLRGHLSGIEGFTQVAVQGNTQLRVGLFIFLKRDLNKPLPQRKIFLVAHLHLVELGTSCVCKLGLALLLLFGDGVVDLNVKLHQRVNAARLNHFLAAPGAVSKNQLAKLRTPVAKVVDTKAIVARKLMHFLERMADDRGAQVTDMEGLCHVGRGIVQHDLFVLSDIGRTVLFLFLKHGTKHVACQISGAQTDIEIAVDCRNLREKRRRKAFCQRVRDLDGRGAERAAELEAGQGQIAHRGIGRIFKHGIDLFCLQCSCGERGGNRIRDQGGGLGFEF